MILNVHYEGMRIANIVGIVWRDADRGIDVHLGSVITVAAGTVGLSVQSQWTNINISSSVCLEYASICVVYYNLTIASGIGTGIAARGIYIIRSGGYSDIGRFT